MAFTLDASALLDQIEQDTLGRETITEMGQLQIVQIRERVAQGIGVDDSPMPPKANGSKRTLLDTGAMLRSMHTTDVTQTSTGWEATIAFATSQNALKAAHNQQRAPWFGFSPKDEAGLQQLAQAYLDERRNKR